MPVPMVTEIGYLAVEFQQTVRLSQFWNHASTALRSKFVFALVGRSRSWKRHITRALVCHKYSQFESKKTRFCSDCSCWCCCCCSWCCCFAVAVVTIAGVAAVAAAAGAGGAAGAGADVVLVVIGAAHQRPRKGLLELAGGWYNMDYITNWKWTPVGHWTTFWT